MDKLREELEVLKSWGIENISVDKILNMIKEVKDGSKISPTGQHMETLSKTVSVTPVGGTIFYIDETADGVYEFFDEDGNLLKNVQVGDKPYSYRVVKKGFKDKYYVYHDKVYDNVRWTYWKDNDYVYEFLNTSNDEGLGKTNTETVMSKDSGAYITADSNGIPTIWYKLQQVRNARVGGCDDWFVPSRGEILILKDAIKLGDITGGTIAGSSYNESIFITKWLWSSGEYNSQRAWHWSDYYQTWYYYYKSNIDSVFFTRAF